MSTGHANSPEDMLSRLETMILMGIELPLPAVRRQISSGIDIIVHVGRMRDKTRKVMQITEITGFDSMTQEVQSNVLYEYQEEGEDECGKIKGQLIKKGELQNLLKLKRAGYRL